MKKIFLIISMLNCCVSVLLAQTPEAYYKLGMESYNKKEYIKAYGAMVSAVKDTWDDGRNIDITECRYIMAKSLFYEDYSKYEGIIEENLSIALNSKRVDILEFYVFEYPKSVSNINLSINAENFKKRDKAYVYFLLALISINDTMADEKRAFEYTNKSIQAGFKLDPNYKNIEFLNKNYNKYYKVLERFNYKTSYNIQIKYYVERNINNWQKKGKFEKTEDYKNRVSEDARTLKSQELVQSFIDSVGENKIQLLNATNEYDADNEVFKIIYPNKNIFLPVPLSEAPSFDRNFSQLEYVNKKFTLYDDKFDLLSLEIQNPENKKVYTYDSKEAIAFNSSELNLNFEELQIDIKNEQTHNNVTESVSTINIGKSDVDQNIPDSKLKNSNKYALIIGNEDYKTYQASLKEEQNVEFAARDASFFKEYCIKTLGIPEENIIFKTNAGVVQMQQSINQLNAIIKNMEGNADVIFYYAGHGFPSDASGIPYLIPVDVSSSSLNMAIKLNSVIDRLTEYPSQKVILFLDACFSGGGRELGLLASRGVKIVPKDADIKGNMVIFSASSSEQSALPYVEKNHGLFTYYLLKKLQETNGDVNLGELDKYLSKQVSIKSTMILSKEQNPRTQFSMGIAGDWETWMLK